MRLLALGKIYLHCRCLMLVFFASYLMAAPVSSLADGIKPLMTVVISREKKLTPDHDDYYFSKVLELALAKTVSTHGPY